MATSPSPILGPIIARCGGTQAVANALEVRRGAVNAYVAKDAIPAWHIPTLIRFARSKGIALTPCHFFADQDCRCSSTRGKAPGRARK